MGVVGYDLQLIYNRITESYGGQGVVLLRQGMSEMLRGNLAYFLPTVLLLWLAPYYSKKDPQLT